MGREYLPPPPLAVSLRPDSRYHAFTDNPYPYPADETEAFRLDALQDMHRILFGKNVFAPIHDLPGTQIVDLGTGSGTNTDWGRGS